MDALQILANLQPQQTTSQNNMDQLAALAWGWQLISWRNDQEIIWGQVSKQDKKIQSYQNKMNSYLTDDEAANSIITTPQSQWDAYQIATANLNPDLKSRNKKYQSTLNEINILENEKVNLSQAGEMMMNAYKNAINSTQNAADAMMYSNAANAAIQAWWAISATPGLAVNPMAAAQTRMSAQNQAMLQNAQIMSNADQNIGNIYWNMAQIPQVLSWIWAQNANIDLQKEQLDLQREQMAQQAELQKQQLAAQKYSWWSSSYSSALPQNTAWLQFDSQWRPTYNWQQLDLWVDKSWNVFIKNASKLWLTDSDIQAILSEFSNQDSSTTTTESTTTWKKFNPDDLASIKKASQYL